jgi:hypothetical protein
MRSRFIDNRDLPDDYYDIVAEEQYEREQRCRCRSTSIEPCDYCDGSMGEDKESDDE